MKAVRELEVNIELPDGASLITGKLKTKVGQLPGRDARNAFVIWTDDSTKERVKVEWAISAPQGGQAVVTAVHQRAGTVRTVLDFDAAANETESDS